MVTFLVFLPGITGVIPFSTKIFLNGSLSYPLSASKKLQQSSPKRASPWSIMAFPVHLPFHESLKKNLRNFFLELGFLALSLHLLHGGEL
ncbi:hypothetical protein [Candidatus Neptunichlamydia sp. REUL1]|uniref:hypothetical protein n=1 Tax=Candidatus Neptunichlamydia sp. REUL1 TaxID=3064277 RepID=UPI002930915E|nr:hypothetical protein [Candidatus Neptunochlamydia sp. REUL1]